MMMMMMTMMRLAYNLSLSNKQTNKQTKLNILHYREREEHQSRGEKEQKVFNNTFLPICV